MFGHILDFFDQTPQLLLFFTARLVRLLFEGGVYVFGKPTDINNCWIRYVRAIQWWLLGVGSKHSLSVLLSTVETSRHSYYSRVVIIERKIVRLLFEGGDYLRVAYNTYSPSASPMTVFRKKFVYVCTVAAATIQGWCLFRSELQIVWLLFKGSDYSRVASIRRNTVCSHSHCHN